MWLLLLATTLAGDTQTIDRILGRLKSVESGQAGYCDESSEVPSIRRDGRMSREPDLEPPLLKQAYTWTADVYRGFCTGYAATVPVKIEYAWSWKQESGQVLFLYDSSGAPIYVHDKGGGGRPEATLFFDEGKPIRVLIDREGVQKRIDSPEGPVLAWVRNMYGVASRLEKAARGTKSLPAPLRVNQIPE